MAYPVFQPLSLARRLRLMGRFDHALPIVRVYLLDGRSALQFLRRISQDVLIGGTVIDSLAAAVYDSNHVGRVLRDQLKKLIPIGQLTPHALQLQMLVES